jgi:hypothetical protein
MSRYQRPAAGAGNPRSPARPPAAATSCAVSASMTMFRRSSTRRTTCPAYGSVPDGPMAAGEGPVAAGSVTTRTVKERSWPGCSTRRAWRQKLDPSSGGTEESYFRKTGYGQFCCQLQRETSAGVIAACQPQGRVITKQAPGRGIASGGYAGTAPAGDIDHARIGQVKDADVTGLP